jgi:four helix bundle protein
MNKSINNFYDLDAWNKGHTLVLEIYESTKGFPREEIYGVVSQLRRAASSITANIAEGFARFHFRDKAKFYYNARGSASEVQNFLLLSRDLKYMSMENCEKLLKESAEVSKLINGLIRSIENQT